MKQLEMDAWRTKTMKPDLKMFKMHTHDVYEIFCFISGKAKYFVEGTEYPLNSNDILIMKKAEAHTLLLTKNSPYDRIVVNFDSDLLIGDNADEIIDFLDNRPLGKNNMFPYSQFKEKNWQYYLKKIYSSDDIDTKRLYLTVLLNELREAYPQIKYENTINENIVDIINYINDNLTEDISLDSICTNFNVSKSHTNRKFKKITGSSIWDYIRTKRLILAKNLLMSGENPTKVYLKCGFNDYCSFYKAYKGKYGVSPKNDARK